MTSVAKSSVDPNLDPLKPYFKSDGSQGESSELSAIIQTLQLQPHPEGGYFAETDRDSNRVPNPFSVQQTASDANVNQIEKSRNASTTIFYLLTPKSPYGGFHRNRARTVHTLHQGRGRYVIIHADQVAGEKCPGGYGADDIPEDQRWTGKARIETFIVGHNVLAGERLQWIVEGGKYKCSFLLPDKEDGNESEGVLISETVVPGFEFSDHDFMKPERLQALVTKEQAQEMAWMLKEEK